MYGVVDRSSSLLQSAANVANFLPPLPIKHFTIHVLQASLSSTGNFVTSTNVYGAIRAVLAFPVREPVSQSTTGAKYKTPFNLRFENSITNYSSVKLQYGFNSVEPPSGDVNFGTHDRGSQQMYQDWRILCGADSRPTFDSSYANFLQNYPCLCFLAGSPIQERLHRTNTGNRSPTRLCNFLDNHGSHLLRLLHCRCCHQLQRER